MRFRVAGFEIFGAFQFLHGLRKIFLAKQSSSRTLKRWSRSVVQAFRDVVFSKASS